MWCPTDITYCCVNLKKFKISCKVSVSLLQHCAIPCCRSNTTHMCLRSTACLSPALLSLSEELTSLGALINWLTAREIGLSTLEWGRVGRKQVILPFSLCSCSREFGSKSLLHNPTSDQTADCGPSSCQVKAGPPGSCETCPLPLSSRLAVCGR